LSWQILALYSLIAATSLVSNRPRVNNKTIRSASNAIPKIPGLGPLELIRCAALV